MAVDAGGSGDGGGGGVSSGLRGGSGLSGGGGVPGVAVAIEAFCDIGCCCLPGGVSRVAGGTREVRACEAFATTKHLELLAVDVRFGGFLTKGGVIKMGQGIAGDEGEEGSLGFPVVAGMAGGAKVQLLPAAQGSDPGDELCRFDSRVILLEPYMLKRRTVTSLAVDAIDDGVAPEDLPYGQRPRWFEISFYV